MKQLHLTLGSGHTHDVDLQPFSMLIVRTRKQNDLGVIEDVEQAYTDVVDVALVEVDDPKIPEAVITQENPFLGTPETAARVAREMPIGDAGQLLEQALEKFPGDAGLLAAQKEISAKMQASTDQPSTAVAETPPTDPFQSEGAAPVEEQQPIETATETGDAVAPDATVATPGTAVPAADDQTVAETPPTV